MEPGKLRHIITIERPHRRQDAHGVSALTWTPTHVCKAQIQSSAGTEQIRAGQIQALITHVVTMRWLADVTPACRVNWQGNILQILEIKCDATFQRVMVLKCSERVAE